MAERRALVRPPGDSLERALSEHPDRASIDPERARAQHARYREALQSLGFEVTVLPVEEDLPDSCFVQDLAILLDGRALLCRPGAPSRRPEADAIRPALRDLASEIDPVAEPATIEGGDVIRSGDRFFVGRSDRTNDEGIEALRSFVGAGGEVVPAEVPAPYLHLLSGLGIADDAVLGSPALIDQPAFEGLERVPIPDEEAVGCNFVVLGRDVLMAAGYRKVRAVLEERGHRVLEVDLSEFAKADGGPTCLSLLAPVT